MEWGTYYYLHLYSGHASIKLNLFPKQNSPVPSEKSFILPQKGLSLKHVYFT